MRALRRIGVGALADRLADLAAARRGQVAAPVRTEPPLARTVARLRRAIGWLEGLHRVQGKVVRLLTADHGDVGAGGGVDEVVVALMRRGARLVWTYPVAAQAAFAALVAEGRAFAKTDEGARLEAALRASPAIERAFRAFEMLTGNVLLDNPDVVLPSGYLDLLVEAATIHDLGPYVARLMKDGAP